MLGRWKKSPRQTVPGVRKALWNFVCPYEKSPYICLPQKWVRWRGFGWGTKAASSQLGSGFMIWYWKNAMESYQGWGLWCKGKHATGEILLLKGISKHPTSISGWSSCGIQDGCSSVFGWWLARSSNEEDLGAPGVLIPNPLRGKREPVLPLGQKQESGERNQNIWWVSAPWVRLSVAQLGFDAICFSCLWTCNGRQSIHYWGATTEGWITRPGANVSIGPVDWSCW